MTTHITPQEKQDLNMVTQGYGNLKRFMQWAGVSETPINKLKNGLMADEEAVEKIRVALRSSKSRQLIKNAKKAKDAA